MFTKHGNQSPLSQPSATRTPGPSEVRERKLITTHDGAGGINAAADASKSHESDDPILGWPRADQL